MLGISWFVKNIKRNILGSLLIAVILCSSSCVFSMYSYEYRKLSVFEKFKENDGAFFENSDIETIIFKGVSDGINKIKEEYKVNAIHRQYRGSKPYENVNLIAYGDYIYKKYKPTMLHGKWLDEVVDNDEYIHVVISSEPSGIQVGDIISFYEDENEYYVEGIIADGAEVLFQGNEYKITNTDYSAYYKGHFYDVEREFCMLVREQDVKDLYRLPDCTKTIIVFDDNISESDKRANYEYMNQIGHYIRLDEFWKNSRKVFFNWISASLPTFLIAILIIVLSLITISIINYRSSIKYFSVYYSVGMSIGHYVSICTVSQMLMFLIGIICAEFFKLLLIILYGKTIFTSFISSEYILWVCWIIIIYILHLVISIALFYRYSPVEAIRQRGKML